MEILRFVYRNAAGESRQRELKKWEEVGHYITGFSIGDGAVRTFRKDRISEYLDGAAGLLEHPFASAPPRIEKDRPVDQRSQICLTGFSAELRAELEQKCTDAGLVVRKSVTPSLTYLCTGPKAGWAKIEKSRAQNVYIVSEEQLHLLMETGELPDL